MTNERTPRSANLDLLRSFAVCAVLITHLSELNWRHNLFYVGVAGVLLFFIHTSNVLLQSLDRLHADGLGRVNSRFFIQRLFRIYPLYLAAIAVALATRVPWIEWLGPYPSAPWLGWKWLASNALMIQNLTKFPSVSPPMWSLPYEMQMYLALPAVFFLAKRKEPMVTLLLVSLFGAFAAAITSGFIHSNWAQPTFYVPCFMGGAYAFVLSKTRRVAPWFTLPILLIISIALVSWLHHPSFEWLICTVIGFSLPKIREVESHIIRGACHMVAKYSYGVYLWHLPLLWYWFHKTAASSEARFAGFFTSLAIVCIASYHLLEEPLIRTGRRISNQRIGTLQVSVSKSEGIVALR